MITDDTSFSGILICKVILQHVKVYTGFIPVTDYVAWGAASQLVDELNWYHAQVLLVHA